MPRAVFKTLEIIAGRFYLKAGRTGVLLVLSALASSSACSVATRGNLVSARTLENAPPAGPNLTRRAILSPFAVPRTNYRPLGPRLGLIQIRSESEWEALRAAAPELGPCPDLSRGIVIGLLSHAGQPVSGRWPIRLEAVRVHRGAGFATGTFEGGSYLPDDTAYLEIAQFDDLHNVLMVDIDGTRFYPEGFAK